MFSLHGCWMLNDNLISLLALVITNGPVNVTVCSGTKANISCGYTGVNPFDTMPNWRIVKRNNNGSVISNETISGMDIRRNRIDELRFIIAIANDNSANRSYLSVGPVDDTYNTSYQCIFTINDNIIESDTTGTITVIGMCSSYMPITCNNFLNQFKHLLNT